MVFTPKAWVNGPVPNGKLDAAAMIDVETRLSNYTDSVGGGGSGTGIPTVFNVKDAAYGATGNGSTNDTTAINAALTAANSAGGGIVFFPKGTYLANSLVIPGSNIHLRGSGWGSILKQVSSAADNTWLLSAFGSGITTASNLVNITISDLQLLGRADTDTFTQYVHLLALGGVSDVVIERCYFNTFRGDGIVLASNNNAGTQLERHNERVSIRDCKFYGGTARNNRNGISIIDGTDINIETCGFDTLTTTNMPGAIDIEPNNNVYHRIRNITIRGCSFTNIGGNAGVISYYNIITQASLTTPSIGIRVIGNSIRNCTNSIAAMFMQQSQTPTVATERSDILIADNHIESPGWQPFEIGGLRGIRIERNHFSNCPADTSMGYAFKLMDCVIAGNDFYKCGTTNGRVLAVINVDRLRIERNVFDTNGDGSTFGEIVRFTTNATVGSSNAVDMIGNRVVGYASALSTKAAAHTLTASTNKWENNDTTLTPVATHFAKTSLLPLGGTFTSTPGAVSTVNIAHSLGVTPTVFQVARGDANARAAPAFSVTADATNVILTFASALTAATAYTWNWMASY